MNLQQLLPLLRFKIPHKLKHLVSFRSNKTLYILSFSSLNLLSTHHLTTNQHPPMRSNYRSPLPAIATSHQQRLHRASPRSLPPPLRGGEAYCCWLYNQVTATTAVARNPPLVATLSLLAVSTFHSHFA